jgi:hypothetical protein
MRGAKLAKLAVLDGSLSAVQISNLAKVSNIFEFLASLSNASDEYLNFSLIR